MTNDCNVQNVLTIELYWVIDFYVYDLSEFRMMFISGQLRWLPTLSENNLLNL